MPNPTDESEDADDAKPGWLRRAGWALGGVLLVGGLTVLLFNLLLAGPGQDRRQMTTVMKVILPAPPPPLLKPPPPKVAEKPAPKPVQPPPASPLTAEAGSGPNAYGLAVGDGSGNVIGGTGRGATGNALGFYNGLIQSQVQAILKRDEKTRYGRYHLALRLWLNPTGQVTRAMVVSSSGDAGTDAVVARLLTGLSLGEPPPVGMTQPVNIRIGAEPG
jgi:protein TonB